MIVKELIKELQDLIAKEPHKADVQVRIYTTADTELIGEYIYEVISIDDTISDRVDLNI